MTWLTAGADAAFAHASLRPSTALGLGARSSAGRPGGGNLRAPRVTEQVLHSSGAAEEAGSAVMTAFCGACAAGVAVIAASRRRRKRISQRPTTVAAAPSGWVEDDKWDEEDGEDEDGFLSDDDEEWDEGFNPRGAPPVINRGQRGADGFDAFDEEEWDEDELAMLQDMSDEELQAIEDMDDEELAQMTARGGDDPWGGRNPRDQDFFGSPMDDDDADLPMGQQGFDDDEEEWDDADEYGSAAMGYGSGFQGQSEDDAMFDEGNEPSVFDGMDDEPEGVTETKKIGAQEMSLLYDDFEVAPRMGPEGTQSPDEVAARAGYDDEEGGLAVKEKADNQMQRQPRRALNKIEEREYVVAAEGIAIRTLPDERSPRTGEVLRQGEKFTAIEAVDGEGRDQRLYLRLPDGRGWVFDDEKLYPGLPSVKLVAVGGQEIKEDEVAPVKRPLIAVVGRPNVGKSTLVNRICDLPNIHGAIAYDEEGVTRDRTYKEAEHTDDEGSTFMFEVIDTGGLIFDEDVTRTSFKNEIKLQIDTALREAAACIMVVDSQTGPVGDDDEIAKYLLNTYVKHGLKVVLAVAKCDRLESMDIHAAEFWGLGLGEPMPVCCLHGRGIWEVVDTVIDRGCDGLYPQRIRGEDPPPSPRDDAINVAIVGKPNAGKSSLLNALVGEERAIVSDIPGTTTDAIDAYLESDNGNVYRFVDTAGIRRKGRIQAGTEWLSVNRAVKAVKRCDVAVMVLDASEIMTGKQSLGNAYWCPDQQQRWIARQIEEKGAAAVIVLTKWDAVANKDEKTQLKFVQAIRSNLAGVGQWAEVVTVSSRTGQRMGKILEAIDKTMAAHRKRIPTPVLNEVVRDALLWKLPAAKSFSQKQGRIYYAVQTSTEPPQIALFCNSPKLFGANYKTYLENKLRQDLGWFGTPIQLEWRKRSEKRAVSQADQWLGPRLQPEPTFMR